ncbi:MAG: flavin reductase family protein [Phycisphaeraceae bacterium]|nr:flavin reductase family protein [Phycisphaeraceae bacterium]
MYLDPRTLDQDDRYKLLIGAIVPRPIAFVSTTSAIGGDNLAPFSFFAGVSSEPMSLAFCPANKPDGSMKDTLRNCLPPGHADLGGLQGEHPGQGEFVVNIVPERLAHRMAACAEALPYGESEFDLCGLTREKSVAVSPPRVAESPVSFECRTLHVLRLARNVPGGGNVVIGHIVGVHIRDGLVNERMHIDPTLLDAIGRMGGRGYCRTRDRFEMPMGIEALRSAGL